MSEFRFSILITILSGGLFVSLLAEQAAGQLEFEQTEVYYEAKPEDAAFRTAYRFTNTSSDTVHISDVKSSCGCTAAKPSKKKYRPGETGEIAVEFDFGNRQGEQVKTIQVKTNKNPDGHLLILHVDIPQILEINPPIISWDHNANPEAQAFEVNILTREKISVIDANLTLDEGFTARIEEIKKGRRYKVWIAPDDTRKFKKAAVKIKTDFPDKKSGKEYDAFCMVKPPLR